ncbi:MAG: hypothetical protein LBH52_00765 [Puniceicoccales bacterium]|jgi:hypothetical protein|nr:hypothetical protein [Puniceicoccales bacterium]
MKKIIQTITAVGLMVGTVNLSAWHCTYCNETHADTPGSYCPKTCLQHCPECGKQHVLSFCPEKNAQSWDDALVIHEGFVQYLKWLDLWGSIDDFETFLNVVLIVVRLKGGVISIEQNVLYITDSKQSSRSCRIGVNGISPEDFCRHSCFHEEPTPVTVLDEEDPIFDDVLTKLTMYQKGFAYLAWLDLYGMKEGFEDILTVTMHMINIKGGVVIIDLQGRLFCWIRTTEDQSVDGRYQVVPPFVRLPRGSVEIFCHEPQFVGKPVFPLEEFSDEEES